MKKFPYYDVAKEFNDAVAKTGFYDKATKTQAQTEIAAARERDIARAAATIAAREREQAERVRMMDEEDRRRIAAERLARDEEAMRVILANYPPASLSGGTLSPAVERRLMEAGRGPVGEQQARQTAIYDAAIDREWNAITAPWANDPIMGGTGHGSQEVYNRTYARRNTQAEIDRKIAEGVAAELARQKKNDLAVAPPDGSGRRRLPA